LDTEQIKTCINCNENKKLNDFHIGCYNVCGKPYYKPVCKCCIKIRVKNNNKKETLKKRNITNSIDNTKECTACYKVLDINSINFRKRSVKNNKISFTSKCKPCEKITQEISRNKNKKKYLQIWKLNNDKRIHKNKAINARSKELRDNKLKNETANEKETRLQKHRTYIKNKKNNNPNFKLRIIISNAILKQLKNKNSIKNNKSSILNLTYTVQQLKDHIETQFKNPGNEWMNWNNWRKYNDKKWDDNNSNTWVWNLDHIVPHSMFKYLNMECEDFLACWDLSNLRPYSAKQNSIDGCLKIRHKQNLFEAYMKDWKEKKSFLILKLTY